MQMPQNESLTRREKRNLRKELQVVQLQSGNNRHLSVKGLNTFRDLLGRKSKALQEFLKEPGNNEMAEIVHMLRMKLEGNVTNVKRVSNIPYFFKMLAIKISLTFSKLWKKIRSLF